MSVDVKQLLPPETGQQQPAVPDSTAPQTTAAPPPPTASLQGPPGINGGGGGGGGGGRKRKRHSAGGGGGGNWNGQNNNNNNFSKRQKNKQQNIIICGGGGGGGGGSLNNPTNNNNLSNKSNAENYGGGGRKNFYHKIHFRQLNSGGGGGGGGGGNRSRRLQIFPSAALTKFFLPDKRPRKEIIVPPTKFLLGGNISDPLNLNSLQDDDVTASPKSSPMMTPPKVEVIIPPNIRDPLHLLDPVDSIEYEKQLTSPMKKMMMMGGSKKNNRGNNNKKKKGRNSFQKNNSTVTSSSLLEDGGGGGGGAAASTGTVSEGDTLLGAPGDRLESNGGTETATEGGGGEGSEENRSKEASVLDLSTKSNETGDQEVSQRKRRISETTTASQAVLGKPKLRRLDSIVSPVIPQPGAHKRPPPMGPQGAPHRNRQRTQSVQSQENEDLGVAKHLKEEEKEDKEAKKENSIKTESVAGEAEPGTSEKSGGGAGEEGGVTVSTEAGKAKGGKDKEKNTNNNNQKKKNGNSVFQFGNYDRYYGYRNLNEGMDVRLQVFKQNEFLFKDKDVLDIGCNVGHITTAVAKEFAPRSVLGLDIDPKLIRRAKENASLFIRVPWKKENEEKDKERPQDKNVARMAATASTSKEEPKESDDAVPGTSSTPAEEKKPATRLPEKQSEARVQFPGNLRFISSNYVLKTEQQLANDERHKYDLVLCLSVTKWVHLNYGDVGLKMMFRRIFNQLRPGGKFILEAQNWASYKKKKKLTERIFRNFQQIEFYPSQFHEYLLSPEVGFSHSYPLGVPRHLSKGFRRPIQLYVKGDFTPSQVMWSDAHQPAQTPYTPYRGIYAEMMCPPPRGYNMPSSVWGGGDNTPYRPIASTSQYYNPLETDSYLPSYETEVSTRRYCFQSPLYSAEWSPPPLSSSNSETRTPPKQPSTWSVSTTPMTPSQAFGTQGGGSVTNTPHHRHVYPPDESLLDLENADYNNSSGGGGGGGNNNNNNNGVSSSGDTPRTEEDSPEH